MVDFLALQPFERILDIACGTGVTTRLASQKVGPDGQVDGLDVNATMLSQAKELANGQNIRWLECDVCKSDLPSVSYDVVMSQHGYHYFPDKPRALAEILRLLVPGGRMAFTIWAEHSPYTQALCAAVERHISPEIAQRQSSQRETPSAEMLASQVIAAGFKDVIVQRQELSIKVPLAEEFVPLHLASMPIADAFLALPEDGKAALVSDVGKALNEYVDNDHLVCPDAVHVAAGVK